MALVHAKNLSMHLNIIHASSEFTPMTGPYMTCIVMNDMTIAFEITNWSTIYVNDL